MVYRPKEQEEYVLSAAAERTVHWLKNGFAGEAQKVAWEGAE